MNSGGNPEVYPETLCLLVQNINHQYKNRKDFKFSQLQNERLKELELIKFSLIVYVIKTFFLIFIFLFFRFDLLTVINIKSY